MKGAARRASSAFLKNWSGTASAEVSLEDPAEHRRLELLVAPADAGAVHHDVDGARASANATAPASVTSAGRGIPPAVRLGLGSTR